MSDIAYLAWETPSSSLRLEQAEVHVWRATLDPAPDDVAELSQLLSSDERLRARRFYFERDRRRFVVARGILRLLVSEYLAVEPGCVAFCYGRYGKPFLSNEFESSCLQFNLSHAHELALYAFSYGRAVGIDLERIKPDRDITGIAVRFFSPNESARLLALPKTQQRKAFFNCWTRKEAYLKAKGAGLTLPLDRFEVSFGDDQTACLLEVRDDPEEIRRWSFRALNPASGYTGAVVVEGCNWTLKCWQWPAPSS